MLLVCTGGYAKGKKKARKGKKAVAEKVDTCSVDTFSYAFGIANTNGLSQYLVSRMGVDMAYLEDFLKGFDAGTEDEACKKMRAYCAAQIDLLWDEVKRFENPHNYYVDLSQKLWDIKHGLLKQRDGK